MRTFHRQPLQMMLETNRDDKEDVNAHNRHQYCGAAWATTEAPRSRAQPVDFPAGNSHKPVSISRKRIASSGSTGSSTAG
jgi:hypothetical protein